MNTGHQGTKTPKSTGRSAFAAAISRSLRLKGVHTVAGSSGRSREGVRVGQGSDASYANIEASFASDITARHMIDDIVELLHESGFRTRRFHDAMLVVYREGDAADSIDERHLKGETVDGVWTYPTIRSPKRSAVVTKADDQWRPIRVSIVHNFEGEPAVSVGYSPEDAIKLAEQLYHAATGKELPR